jgi:hypothetical protein
MCRGIAGPEFGEEGVTVGPKGVVRSASGPLRARYVVAPASLGVQGRVVAWNPMGRELLLAPNGGVVTVPAPAPARPPGCPPPRSSAGAG